MTVVPTTSSGIELDAMITRETTAPIPEDVYFPMIRSTQLQIILPDVSGAEDFRIKIHPEVSILSQQKSMLTVQTKPSTQYTGRVKFSALSLKFCDSLSTKCTSTNTKFH